MQLGASKKGAWDRVEMWSRRSGLPWKHFVGAELVHEGRDANVDADWLTKSSIYSSLGRHVWFFISQKVFVILTLFNEWRWCVLRKQPPMPTLLIDPACSSIAPLPLLPLTQWPSPGTCPCAISLCELTDRRALCTIGVWKTKEKYVENVDLCSILKITLDLIVSKQIYVPFFWKK
jgi:hypothetical protein